MMGVKYVNSRADYINQHMRAFLAILCETPHQILKSQDGLKLNKNKKSDNQQTNNPVQQIYSTIRPTNNNGKAKSGSLLSVRVLSYFYLYSAIFK